MLTGDTPVTAMLEIQVSGAEGEGSEPMRLDGHASATVGENPGGITITFSRESVENAERETAAEDGAGRDFGARFALRSIDAKEVGDLLNAAPYLTRQLGRSELTEERDDTFDGRPARLLVLKVTPRLNPQARKILKDVTVTARIWLDGDGLPVGARIEQLRKGRVLLVIGFEANDVDEYRYKVVGDRLVAVQHTRVTSGAGAGQHSNSKMVVDIALPDPTAPVSRAGK